MALPSGLDQRQTPRILTTIHFYLGLQRRGCMPPRTTSVPPLYTLFTSHFRCTLPCTPTHFYTGNQPVEIYRSTRRHAARAKSNPATPLLRSARFVTNPTEHLNRSTRPFMGHFAPPAHFRTSQWRPAQLWCATHGGGCWRALARLWESGIPTMTPCA